MKRTRSCAVVFAAVLLCAAAFAVYVHDVRKHSSLFLAAARNNVVEAWLLIQSGADVNATDNGEVSLLMFAVERAAVLAGLLITSNADVRVSAAYDSALAIVRLLIEAGADINAKNNWGKTALMYAAEEDAADVIELLKTAGAT